MEERYVSRNRLVLRMITMIALSVALAGLGLGAVIGLSKVAQSKEPFVDLSPSGGTTAPAVNPVEGEQRLRFAVATMVSAENTFSKYRRLVERISRDVGYQHAFVLRPTYADVRRELEEKKLDVAFVCTGTYVHSLPGRRIKLLVQPEFENGLEYKSLFIVRAGGASRTLDDLRGKVMAFTDPESNTGCLVPSGVLLNRGDNPRAFFEKIVFTGSHDRSIDAVAIGAVDCAAVDSLVWESKTRENPSLLNQVRVIWESDPFGPPPIVVPVGLDRQLEESLQDAFLALSEDEEGQEILSALGIRRFVPAKPEDYRTAAKLHEELRARGLTPWT